MKKVGCPKGYKQTKEHIEKCRQAKIGKKRPKHSERMKGENNPNYKKIAWNRGKKRPKHSERMKGENNPNWRGGVKEYCKDFYDIEWRKYIYERDYYSCRLCGCSKHLSYKIFGRKCDIHHIDYNKKNCNPNNCICLCLSCHTKLQNKKFRKDFENYLKGARRNAL